VTARLITYVSALVAVVALVSACDPLGRPSLNPAFGAREVNGQLAIWTGSTCHDVVGLELTFDPMDQAKRAQVVMSAPSGPGVDVDRFTLGQPVPGLPVTQPLPLGFDWRTAESVRIGVTGSGEKGGWGSTTQLADVIKDSSAHPDDTYYFQDVGWLNPAQVAEQDAKTFLATCTDSPD
jgi:hypothetical protein